MLVYYVIVVLIMVIGILLLYFLYGVVHDVGDLRHRYHQLVDHDNRVTGKYTTLIKRYNQLFDENNKATTIKAKYNELLMGVASKFPDESRHETALRYITSMENVASVAQLMIIDTESEDGK